MLVVVPVVVVSAGFAVVANVLVIVTIRKAMEFALSENGSVLSGSVRVVASVLVGIKEIKGRLVLEGSAKGGVFLRLPF